VQPAQGRALLPFRCVATQRDESGPSRIDHHNTGKANDNDCPLPQALGLITPGDPKNLSVSGIARFWLRFDPKTQCLNVGF